MRVKAIGQRSRGNAGMVVVWAGDDFFEKRHSMSALLKFHLFELTLSEALLLKKAKHLEENLPAWLCLQAI